MIEKVILPLGDKYLHTSFIKELKYWRNKVDKMNADQLHALQQERLQKLLKHAIQNIPFYKSAGIRLAGDPYKDILKFPVMYKQMIKDNLPNLYLGDRNKMVVEKSSGSSGIQGEVYMTREENLNYQAIQTYLWEWGGYRLGAPLLQTGMNLQRTGIKGIKDSLLRTLYVDAFNLTYEKAVENLLHAQKRGCRFFGGYASSLNVYAEAAIKAGLNIRFDGVISWGDKLFDEYKANINKAFNHPTLAEVYGTTEGFMMAGLCPHGKHHILTPHVYIELLDDNGNEVNAGELGHVVVTRLDAYSFPLIRYYLGDLAIKESDDAKCKCGRSFPLLKKIVGRDTDIVHTPRKNALIVHFFTAIFEHEPAIKQFRVLQKKEGEIEIEYIPSNDFDQDVLHRLSGEIVMKANENFPIKFIKVDKIPNTPSGKPQLIENTIIKRSAGKSNNDKFKLSC